MCQEFEPCREDEVLSSKLQEPLKDFRQRSSSGTFALSKDPHGNSARYELEGDKGASGQKNNDDPTYSIVHGVDKNI